MVIMKEVEPQDSLLAKINSSKYSSYLKFVQVTARVLAMFQNCQKLSIQKVAILDIGGPEILEVRFENWKIQTHVPKD